MIRNRGIDCACQRAGQQAVLETLEPRLLLSSYIVDSLADTVAADGFITLREAILAVNTGAAVNEAVAGGTGINFIEFAPALFAGGPASIVLGGTELVISKPLTITGPGANLLTIDANDQSRVFNMHTAPESPAGIKLLNMTLSGGRSLGDGGALITSKNVLLDNVTIRDSQAVNGGGIAVMQGTLYLSGNTVSDNVATASGGGISVSGGLLVSMNATISGNTAAADGGGIQAVANLELYNTTVADNQANRGGGLYLSGTPKTLKNTLVADNTATTSSADVFGLLTANFSLIENSSGTVILGGLYNLLGVDPLLGPLTETGNGTPTHALAQGSPAIDKGDPLFNSFPPPFPDALIDQRDEHRVVDGDENGVTLIDIGAYEFAPQTGLTVTSLGFPVVNGDASTTFVIRIDDDVAVDISSLGNNDVRITGPNGYDTLATFLGVDNTSDGATRWAFYQVEAPGGVWDMADSGTYTMQVEAGGIGDTQNHFAAPQTLRSFDLQFALFEYVLTPLDVSVTTATDINASGQVVGWRDDSTDRGLLWDDGVRTDLGTVGLPPGGAQALGINDHGQIVGEGSSGSTGYLDTAFIWENGVMTSLGLGTNTVAKAINNAGEVAVDVWNLGVSKYQATHWKNGIATNLGTLGGNESRTFDISQSGSIVGYASTSTTNIERAFVWNGTTMMDLGMLGGTSTSVRESEAFGINDNGMIVGQSRLPKVNGQNVSQSDTRAVRWEDGQIVELVHGSGAAEDINNSDTIVGNATFVSSNEGFLWHKGVAYRLGSLMDMTGYTYVTATAINDQGQIVGQGRKSNGSRVAILLTPNLTPTTTGLADVRVFTDAPDTIINLFAAFEDDRDADDELTYTVEANTNTALFTSLTINGTTGELTLDYAPAASGSALLTIRATDSRGLYVETVLSVDVGAPSTVEGVVWDDADGDGVFDEEELPLEGWMLYIDDNSNGQLDAGEVSVTSDSDGSYGFDNLAPGTYRVTQVVLPAWTTTAPEGGVHVLVLSPGVNESDVNFGNQFQGNTAPTASSLSDVLALRGAEDRVISLASAFADQDEPASALIYTITGNSNPAIFDGVSIDLVTDSLTLDFAAMVVGSSDITIRATDFYGAFVETTFTVTLDAYTFVLLHPEGAVWSIANAIESVYRQGGEYDMAFSNESGAILWYGRPDDFANRIAFEVNGFSDGQFIGTMSTTQGNRAVRFTTGLSGSQLTTGGYYSTYGYGIDQGSIVGVGTLNGTDNALMWNALGQLTVLRTGESGAFGIDGNQQVGEYRAANGRTHAALWSGTSGSMVDLNPFGFESSSAMGVFNGQQVGYGTIASVGTYALLWNGTAASYINLTPDVEGSSAAYAINNGRIVGQAHIHAVLWQNSPDLTIDLHSVIPSELNYHSSAALDVDADGNVVGWVDSVGASAPKHAAMWIRHQGLPDLQGESFTITGTPTQWESPFTVNYDIRNDGTNDAGASEVGFYLSRDGVFDENDLLLGAATVGGLAPFANEQGVMNLTMPATGDLPEGFDESGDYQILMVTDHLDAVEESDETDNSGTGEGVDIVATSVNKPLPPFGWAFNVASEGTGNTYSPERGESVTVDAQGYVYVAMTLSSIGDLDPGPGEHLIDASGRDGIVAKYSANGELVWAVKAFDGGNAGDQLHLVDGARSLVLDSAGDVIVVGSAFNDGMVVKLSGDDGSIVWSKPITADNLRAVTGVVVDAQDNIHIRGVTQRSYPQQYDYDTFIIQLDAAGNQQWERVLERTTSWGGLDVDDAGHVIVAGIITTQTDFDPGPGQVILGTGSTSKTYLWKLDASGNFVSARLLDIGVVAVDDLQLDAMGNIVLTGSATSNSMYVAKLDAAGDTLWYYGLNVQVPNLHRDIIGLTVSDTGDVYVTGAVSGTVDADLGPGVFTLAAGDRDILVLVLDGQGQFIWATHFGADGATSQTEIGRDIAVAPDGSIISTGYFGETVSVPTADFDPSSRVYELTAAKDRDAYVMKLNPLVSIAGQAWLDIDLDGQRGASDPGIGGIEVRIFDTIDGIVGNGDDVLVYDSVTESDGAYRFLTPIASTFYVEFGQPEGLAFTSQDRGVDESDSDVSAVFGTTGGIVVTVGQSSLNVDAGYIFAGQAPQAVDDVYTVLVNDSIEVPVLVGVLANDTDGLPLEAVLVSGPLHGEFTLHADGSFDYSPDADYFGIDTFTYRAFNGDFASTTATVSIHVNHAPTTTGIADVLVLAGTQTTVISLFAAFADVEDLDDQLIYTVENNTNPALFDAISIDPVQGLITLDYSAAIGESMLTIRATDAQGAFVQTEFAVRVVNALDAPLLLPEPVVTNATSNTIAWEAVPLAQEYFVEADTDPDFGSPDFSSGWITQLSHTFTDLTQGLTYHYRVKARVANPAAGASLTQTTQSDFASGVLSLVTATPAGDVTLQNGVPTPTMIDTIGGPLSNYSQAKVVSMNQYAATESVTLSQIEQYLNITTSTELQFAVYESTIPTSGFTRIALATVPTSGTGQQFYSSGDMSVPIVAGRYYIIAVGALGNVTYYTSNPTSNRDTDWGTQTGAQAFSNSFPPATTMTAVATNNASNHQRLTSTGGTGYAAAGSITSALIEPSPLDVWEQFNFHTTTPAGTAITFDILPATGSTPIPGYANLPFGADLSGLAEQAIRIRANLSTTDFDITPTLHDWSITWQATAAVTIESDWSATESSTQSGPPTTTGIADVQVDQGTADAQIDLFAAFADAEEPDADLVYTIEANSNETLFDDVIIDAVAGTIEFDFADGAYGQAQLTVRATDSGGLFVETTFTVIVDDAPTTTGIDDVAVLEDASPFVIDLFAAFADSVDADEDLTYAVVTNTAAGLFASTDIDPLAGTLTLDFAANAFGDGSITVRATDILGRAVEAAFTVTVASVNDEPTTTGLAPVNAYEDGNDQVIDLFAAFADVETADEDLILTIESNTNASLFSSVALDDDTGLLTIDFAPDISGVATLVLRATDALGLFIETTLIVNVEALADISGIIWQDLNGDGTQALNDPGQADVTVYLDLNNNGAFDDGEPTQITASDGSYRFTGLVAGVYTVAEVVPTGFVQTSPGSLGSPVPPFRIDLLFGAGVTESQKAIFAQAATRWSQIIIADLPDAITDVGIVDDLAISIRGITIDGEGNTLAQAAPTQLRTGTNLPVRGVMDMDIADLAALEASGDLYQIVLHEMAHVLGFGNLWVNMGLITGAGTTDPQFTGTQAAAVYAALTGSAQTSVPVANTGGTGTRDIHWREVIFDSELLTGVIDAGANPLSRLSLAALADMGYIVNLNAADPYTLPGGQSTGGSGAVQPLTPPRPFTHQIVIAGGIDVDHVDFGNASLGSVVVGPQVAALTPAPGSTLIQATIHIDITFTKAMMGLDVTDLVLTGTGAAGAIISAPLSLGGNIWRYTISGLVPGDLNVTLAPDAGDIQDLAGNDLEPLAWSYKVDDLVADAPPIVTAVMLGSTTWGTGAGDGPSPSDVGEDSGYLMPVTSGDQLDALPWQKLNRISVRFSEAVDVQADDLTLLGMNVANYAAALTGFAYDSDTFTATWQLATPIAIDKLRLILSDRITDATGRALDGDWIDGSSAASGNGSEGGDFQFRFNVLPGDADGSGEVDADDLALIRGSQFQSAGGAGYHERYDINGSGSILIDDVIFVRNQQTMTLPAGEPAFAPVPPVGEMVTTDPISITNESTIARARVLASYAIAHGKQGSRIVTWSPPAAATVHQSVHAEHQRKNIRRQPPHRFASGLISALPQLSGELAGTSSIRTDAAEGE